MRTSLLTTSPEALALAPEPPGESWVATSQLSGLSSRWSKASSVGRPRRVRVADFGYLAASLVLHVVGFTGAAFVRFEVPAESQLLFAVRPSFAGGSIAQRAAPAAAAPAPAAAPITEPEREPEVAAWVTHVRESALLATLAAMSVSPAGRAEEAPESEPAPTVPAEPAAEPPAELVATEPVELEERAPSAAAPREVGRGFGHAGLELTASARARLLASAAAANAGSGALDEGGEDAVDAAASPGTGRDTTPGSESTPGVQGAQLLDAKAPVYPPLSVRAGEEGTVHCRLHISAEGEVTAVDVVTSSGHARLDRAAVKALSGWRFDPSKLDVREFPTTLLHQVVFQLED